MLKRLLELIKQALRSMVAYKDISATIGDVDVQTISDEMTSAIEKWKSMYKDEPEWLDEDNGVYTLGLPKSICQELKRTVLSELKTYIHTKGSASPLKEGEAVKTRAGFLDNLYQKHLVEKLDNPLEYAMAVGGMIIKPYISNGSIYFDFSYQGEFYPIQFDDDGVLTDVAFYDQFVQGDVLYTRVERQTFSQNKLVVENKAYRAKVNTSEDKQQELGLEIPLTSVGKWASITPTVTINDVERPLYGYYKVPLANNVDIKSPLGISVFSPASSLIKRADVQFSRLDWEYEGGQLAIDVDTSAVKAIEGYYGTVIEQDQTRNRLYRKIDLGSDDTYNAFAPTLRDGNYRNGLTSYLTQIEDKVGIARGSLSEVQVEARTATEIRTLKQRQYQTVTEHQKSINTALENAIYAANVLVELYQKELKAPDTGDYELVTEWNDSILVDAGTELEQKVTLKNEGILADYEVRAWYTGEDEKTAMAKIATIKEEKQKLMMNDLFSTVPQVTLESSGSEADEDDENEDR